MHTCIHLCTLCLFTKCSTNQMCLCIYMYLYCMLTKFSTEKIYICMHIYTLCPLRQRSTNKCIFVCMCEHNVYEQQDVVVTK